MAVSEVNYFESGGGGGTLVLDGYDSGDVFVTSFSTTSDHDALLLVSRGTGTSAYVPSYNGVTYNWNIGNGTGTDSGSSVIIPNYKANTAITFSAQTRFRAYGYSIS